MDFQEDSWILMLRSSNNCTFKTRNILRGLASALLPGACGAVRRLPVLRAAQRGPSRSGHTQVTAQANLQRMTWWHFRAFLRC